MGNLVSIECRTISEQTKSAFVKHCTQFIIRSFVAKTLSDEFIPPISTQKNC